jgi:hypothetical protein
MQPHGFRNDLTLSHEAPWLPSSHMSSELRPLETVLAALKGGVAEGAAEQSVEGDGRA